MGFTDRWKEKRQTSGRRREENNICIHKFAQNRKRNTSDVCLSKCTLFYHRTVARTITFHVFPYLVLLSTALQTFIYYQPGLVSLLIIVWWRVHKHVPALSLQDLIILMNFHSIIPYNPLLSLVINSESGATLYAGFFIKPICLKNPHEEIFPFFLKKKKRK